LKAYTYSDFDSKLQVTDSGNVKIVYDIDVILQSIKHIFTTVSGERVRTDIGGSLVRYLFQPMSADLVDDIRRNIVQSINKFEPRVEVLNIRIFPNYDGNYYDISLELYIRDINQTAQYSAKLRAFT
jgi:hypothetical protein